MSERDEFERWAEKRGWALDRHHPAFGDGYRCSVVQYWWEAWQARADLAAEREREAEVIKESVARVMSDDELGDGLGYWDSCTGCHETNEGQETGDYPFSDIFGCHLGGGCTECGGLGAVWHFMPDEMLEQMAQEARDGQGG